MSAQAQHALESKWNPAINAYRALGEHYVQTREQRDATPEGPDWIVLSQKCAVLKAQLQRFKESLRGFTRDHDASEHCGDGAVWVELQALALEAEREALAEVAELLEPHSKGEPC